MVLNAALKIKPICSFYVVILVLQNCKISSHFFYSLCFDVSNLKGKCGGVIFFIPFCPQKTVMFWGFHQKYDSSHAFLMWGRTFMSSFWMHYFCVLFPLLFPLAQVQVLCLTRGIQCDQNAAAAWLDTWWLWCWIPSKQPLCSGLSERWMTAPTGLFRSCNAVISEDLVQEGVLTYLDKTIFKLKPQVSTLMKSSFNRIRRLQTGFLS